MRTRGTENCEKAAQGVMWWRLFSAPSFGTARSVEGKGGRAWPELPSEAPEAFPEGFVYHKYHWLAAKPSGRSRGLSGHCKWGQRVTFTAPKAWCLTWVKGVGTNHQRAARGTQWKTRWKSGWSPPHTAFLSQAGCSLGILQGQSRALPRCARVRWGWGRVHGPNQCPLRTETQWAGEKGEASSSSPPVTLPPKGGRYCAPASTTDVILLQRTAPRWGARISAPAPSCEMYHPPPPPLQWEPSLWWS